MEDCRDVWESQGHYSIGSRRAYAGARRILFFIR